MSGSDSLWVAEPDDDLKRSIKRNYARTALAEFMDGLRASDSFLKAIQKLLCAQDPKARGRFGKSLFNSGDREFIGELVQLSTLAKPKNKTRVRGNRKSPLLLRQMAQTLAVVLLNERPAASRVSVERRVYEVMAIDNGEFIQSRRTVEIWLKPFFQKRRRSAMHSNQI